MEKNLTLPFGPSEPSRATEVAVLAIAAFLGVSRVWVGGYSFGGADQSWQAPLVEGLARGRVLQDYIFSPVPKLSLFFPLAAAFARVWPIETVYFAGYVLASVATAAAAYLLAFRMLKSRAAAMLAVVMLLVGKDVVAGATTWDAAFLPRTAAMPFMLLSWWMLLGARPGDARAAWAGLLMGAAFALHPLTGIYGALIAAASMPLAPRETRGAMRRFAAGMAGPVVITLFYIFPSPAPLFDAPREWFEAMVTRNLHHVVLSSAIVFTGVTVYALAAGIGTRLLGGTGRLLIAGAAVSAGLLVYCGAAVAWGRLTGASPASAMLLEPPVIATLQPLRISGPLGILIFIATAGMLWRAMQGGFVARLSAAGSVAALAGGEYWVGGALLVAAGLALRRWALLRAMAIVVAAAALAAAFGYHKTLFMLIVAVMAAAMVAAFAGRTRMHAAGAALAAVVALVGIMPPEWAAHTARRAFGPGARMDDAEYERPVTLGYEAEPALIEAAAWVRANAKENEVTIVPPWWESFRVAAERPVYGTWKDGTLVFFNEGLAGEWLSRMKALDVPLAPGAGSRMGEAARESYGRLDAARIYEAARLHPAAYVVRLAPDMPGHEVAYQGRHVTIYKL